MELISNMKLRKMLNKADKLGFNVDTPIEYGHHYPNSDEYDMNTFTNKDFDNLLKNIYQFLTYLKKFSDYLELSKNKIFIPNTSEFNDIKNKQVAKLIYGPKSHKLNIYVSNPKKKLHRKKLNYKHRMFLIFPRRTIQNTIHKTNKTELKALKILNKYTSANLFEHEVGNNNIVKFNYKRISEKVLNKIDDDMLDACLVISSLRSNFRKPHRDPCIILPNEKRFLNFEKDQKEVTYATFKSNNEVILTIGQYITYDQANQQFMKKRLKKLYSDPKSLHKYHNLVKRLTKMRDKVNDLNKKDHVKALLLCGEYTYKMDIWSDKYSPQEFVYPMGDITEKYDTIPAHRLMMFAYMKTEEQGSVNTNDVFVHLKELAYEAHDKRRLINMINHLAESPDKFSIIAKTNDQGQVTKVDSVSVKIFNKMINAIIAKMKATRQKYSK